MEKLLKLRALMKEKGIDAYVIPSGDAHNSEYVAEYWQSRAWISGFIGSSGTVVVTLSEAGLWTDGRYFIQAAKELTGSGVDLFKKDIPGVPTYYEFLAEKLPVGGKLGFDGRVIPVKEFNKISEPLKDKKITYVYNEDLIGQLWADRPAMPTAPAFEHEPRFAGKSAAEKIADVRREMSNLRVTSYLVVALDDIAWLLNIRGDDVSYLPVVYAYALITENEAHVFIDRNKLGGLASKLEAQGVTFHDYDSIADFLGKLPTTGKLLFNPENTSILLIEALPEALKTKQDLPADALALLKAVKSEVELKNTRNAYIKESIVLVRFLKWIDQHQDISSVTEGAVVRYLTALRLQQPDIMSDAFSTIAAYGANAALSHYHPEGEGDSLKPEGFLLVDTGGQYYDGTTDTTRTIPLGPITDEMKRNFTLVLKGHIALARTIFPQGTTGAQLDTLARVPLWDYGLDYLHGTGHGIGYCLSVHEGPQRLSSIGTEVDLEPGMLLSNEPAFYVEGEYGIRTENIVEVVKTAHEDFYGFESLIYCPIDTSSVDISLLSDVEIDYLNDYHRRTYELISPHLTEEEADWLYTATCPVIK